MFKLFKDKLKDAFNKFSKEVDVNSETVEGEEETKEDMLEEAIEEKEILEVEAEKKESESKKEDTSDTKEKTDTTEEVKNEEKKGFFSKLFKKKEKEDEPQPEDAKKETEHAPTIDELDEEEVPKLKEEEIEIPEDIPDNLSEEDLELVSNKVNKTVDALKRQSEKLLKRDKKEPGEDKTKPEVKTPGAKPASKISPKEDLSKPEKKGFIQKISDSFTKKILSESAFNELFWDLEITLLENNVAVEVIDLIKENLKTELVNNPISRKDIPKTIEKSLKKSIEEVFELDTINFLGDIPNKKPYKILIVGVNGSGKTTTIAKLVQLLKENKYSTVLAAADTFRAAAIDQLEEHANNLGVKIIKHAYNSDPAAVAFDAIKYAEAKGLDTVVIDTAGRLHSNSNLMDELKKVYRVSKPDLTIFIGESITGNDCIEQAKEFQKAVDFDAIILSKADVDEKGGTAISISYVTRKPILYLGVGQEYKDLEEFDKYKVMYRMFGTEIGDEE